MNRFRVGALIILALVAVAVGSPAIAAPLPRVTNVTVTPVPNLASHMAQYTIAFTTSAFGALVPGNTITLKFPSGTVPGASCGNVASFANNVTVNGVTTSVSSIVTCLDVKVTVPVAIGSNSNVTVVVGSVSNVVRNPGKGTYAMKVHTTADFGDVGSARYTIVAQAKPVAGPVAAQSTDEDVAKTITLTGSDADGDPLTFAISSIASHGGLGPITQLTPTSASVTYTPTGNYSGPDSFKFRVNDGIVTSNAATVSITVTAVNDPPVAVDDATTVAQDSGPTTIAVLANDSDADGDTLTITSNTGAADGTASCSTTDCTYTPNAGFSGDDAFTYTIGDGNGGLDSAEVDVEVTPTPGGGGGAVSYEICAKPGTVTMPDAVVIDVWGFALGDCDVAGPATLPGPQLSAHVGDTVSITLDNGLAENVALELPGQTIAPDPIGTPAGTEKTYTFVAGDPGTFLYESGMNRQVLMGLYGALIVRPACAVPPCQAYNGAASTYDVEATLVLSEIDPAFNAAPATFELVNYAPKYWLINGEAHPDTAPIAADADDRVLLRYVNAGSLHHTMALLGMHELVIGRDADSVRYPFEVAAETVAAGSTLDAIATVPTGALSGDTFPLFNRQLHLDNAGAFPGGMLTFLEVP